MLSQLLQLWHLVLVFWGFQKPNSQVTEKELELLLKYSKNADLILEIGCYEGKSSVTLAKKTSGKVISIDPFIKGPLGFSHRKLIAKFYRRKNKAKNLEFIEKFSFDAVPYISQKIDLLFIDGDHSYQAIKQDWQDWYPKVKDGGIIALHDSIRAVNSPEYLGTMKFYEQDIPQISGIKEKDRVDSLAILFKEETGINYSV